MRRIVPASRAALASLIEFEVWVPLKAITRASWPWRRVTSSEWGRESGTVAVVMFGGYWVLLDCRTRTVTLMEADWRA